MTMWLLYFTFYSLLLHQSMGDENSQTNLQKDLLKNYDTYRVPKVHPDNGTEVELGLTIRSFEIDEANLKTTINGWFKMEWNDPRLTWKKSEHGQIGDIRLKPKDIWMPDVLPFTSAEAFTGVSVYQMTDVLIYNSGRVLWVPPMTLNVRCIADTFWWPRDAWTCVVKMGPWTQNAYNVKVVYSKWTHDETPRRRIGDWRIDNVVEGDNIKLYRCCPEPYSDVTWTITLKREGMFYLPTLGMLIIAIVVLTMLVFMLPSRSYAKIYLTTFNLLVLTLCSLFCAVRVPVPDYSSIPAVFRLLATLIVLQMVIMVCEIFVLSLIDAKAEDCPLAAVIGRIAELTKAKKPEASAENVESDDKGEKRSWSRSKVALMIDRVGVAAVFLVLLICCICLWSF